MDLYKTLKPITLTSGRIALDKEFAKKFGERLKLIGSLTDTLKEFEVVSGKVTIKANVKVGLRVEDIPKVFDGDYEKLIDEASVSVGVDANIKTPQDNNNGLNQNHKGKNDRRYR